MKRIALTVLFCMFALGVMAQGVTSIIAKVNNEIITSSDLNEYLQILVYRLGDKAVDFSPDSPEGRKEALERLIEDRLILDQAKQYNVEVPSYWVQAKLDQMIESFPSREHFEKSLIDRGLSVSLLKNRAYSPWRLFMNLDSFPYLS